MWRYLRGLLAGAGADSSLYFDLRGVYSYHPHIHLGKGGTMGTGELLSENCTRSIVPFETPLT